MRPSLLFTSALLLGCLDDTPSDVAGRLNAPETFGEFYSELQDVYCPDASGACVRAADDLDCQNRTSVPSCEDYDPVLAWACLQEEPFCDDGILTSDSRACELVCLDRDFSQIGFTIPESCRQMLVCDEVYAETLGVSRTFDGLQDSGYGENGSCYQNDIEACASACAAAIDVYRAGLDAAFISGTIDSLPSGCF